MRWPKYWKYEFITVIALSICFVVTAFVLMDLLKKVVLL
jgi:uncharacterized protein YpmS